MTFCPVCEAFGERAKHALWFCLWLMSLPLTWLVVHPALFVYHCLRADVHALATGFLCGIFATYAIFLPLSRTPQHSPEATCVSYIGVVGWVLGNCAMCVLVFAGITTYRRPPAVWMKWQHSLAAPMWVGVLFGLMPGFSAATTRYVDPEFAHLDPPVWCRVSAQTVVLWSSCVIVGALMGIHRFTCTGSDPVTRYERLDTNGDEL